MTLDDLPPDGGPPADGPGLPAALRRATAPWLYSWEGPVARLYERAWAWSRAGTTCRVLRGAKMRTEPALFDELAAALQFPDYFGENWAAVDECLTDLEWLPGNGYLLLLADADQVLADEPADRFDLLLRVLERAAQEWARPVERGEDWDRAAVPFHVVLHARSGREGELVDRFRGRRVALLQAAD
jgi:RNAse (barnase) inhibitor barstar